MLTLLVGQEVGRKAYWLDLEESVRKKMNFLIDNVVFVNRLSSVNEW